MDVLSAADRFRKVWGIAETLAVIPCGEDPICRLTRQSRRLIQHSKHQPEQAWCAGDIMPYLLLLDSQVATDSHR